MTIFNIFRRRKKVALSMSGGGIKGLIYLGIIQALEENDIKVDYYAGLSAGALVAGLLGSGKTRDEVMNLTMGFNFWPLVDINPLNGIEILDHKKVLAKLRELVSNSTVESCIPQVVIFVTNVLKKKLEVITHGDLAMAILCSGALPPLMGAIEVDGKVLMEGGFATRYGAKQLRQLGADIVIGSDVDGFANTKFPGLIGDLFGGVSCALALIGEYEQRLDPVDIEIGGFKDSTGIFEFKKAVPSLVALGYKSTVEKMPIIKKLL